MIGAAAVLLTAKIFAIRNVRVFDGTRVIPRANVIVTGDTITAAGADAPIPQGAEVIDGTGKTLVPGLIDAHAHVFGDALERALRFGVTTELDMFTQVALARSLRATSATRADLRTAGTLVTVAGGHGTEYFPIPVYAPGSDPQAFIDARIAEGSDYIKLVYDDGSAYGVKFNTLTKSDLQSLIAAAHKRGKLTVVHIATLQGARDAIEAGADGLAHIFNDAAPDAAFGRFVAAHHAFVVPTLTVTESVAGIAGGASLLDDARMRPFLNANETDNLRASFPMHAVGRHDIANASAAVRALKEAGVPILAGTDAPNPGTAHGASIHRELELLVRAGLTPAEALRAATATPARIFHLDDRGRIAAGARADLLLVDGDPTTDITATRAIAAVWKNGVRLTREPEKAPRQTAVVAAVAPEKLAAGVISTFDGGKADATIGSGWQISTDSMTGGTSTATMEVVDGGANGTPHALAIHANTRAGAMFPWAGAMVFLGDAPMRPVDLSSKSGISFFARCDCDVRIMVFSARAGRIPRLATRHAGGAWTPLSLQWSELGLDGKDIQAILFAGPPAADTTIVIDELTLK